MSHVKSLQALFKRYRRPGDIVFAWAFLLFALFLLSQITGQTVSKSGKNLVAQPFFWPAVSLSLMSLFAGLHLLGSALSERIEGRWKEVLLWGSSIEYAAWFILYATLVPVIGYLFSTIIFAILLTLRVGFRNKLAVGAALLSSLAIVLLFKSFLQVKLPAGQVYEYLPDGLRQIMIFYF